MSSIDSRFYGFPPRRGSRLSTSASSGSMLMCFTPTSRRADQKQAPPETGGLCQVIFLGFLAIFTASTVSPPCFRPWWTAMQMRTCVLPSLLSVNGLGGYSPHKPKHKGAHKYTIFVENKKFGLCWSHPLSETSHWLWQPVPSRMHL